MHINDRVLFSVRRTLNNTVNLNDDTTERQIESIMIIPIQRSELTVIIDGSDNIVNEYGRMVYIASCSDEEKVFYMSYEVTSIGNIFLGRAISNAKTMKTRSEKRLHAALIIALQCSL
jgi:hypothetical protein